MVKEISRVLRPGGVVYIDVPNEDGLYFRVGNFYQRLRRRNWVINLSPTFSPFHVFGFTPRSLRLLLSKHGLRPEVWRSYEGICLLPDSGGRVGALEKLAATLVTRLSKLAGLGNYIETWAIKI
jgi:SAM-dependent methyltransferase